MNLETLGCALVSGTGVLAADSINPVGSLMGSLHGSGLFRPILQMLDQMKARSVLWALYNATCACSYAVFAVVGAHWPDRGGFLQVKKQSPIPI